MTSQCPPLSGPTRRMTPVSLNILNCFSTARVDIPRAIAIFGAEICESAAMNSKIFTELFTELFTEPLSFFTELFTVIWDLLVQTWTDN